MILLAVLILIIDKLKTVFTKHYPRFIIIFSIAYSFMLIISITLTKLCCYQAALQLQRVLIPITITIAIIATVLTVLWFILTRGDKK